MWKAFKGGVPSLGWIMAKGARVGAVDFWRGGVLIVILLDHIPGNLIEWATPRNYGVSDSSEAFVFLSGLSVGMVYGPRAAARGLAAVASNCLKRAWKLYGVHLALTAAALAIFAAAYCLTGDENLIAPHGRSAVFASPASGLAGVALLSHQLGYFNILPLYVVLMLWAPIALALALRSPLSALMVSAIIYFAARLGVNLPNWPEEGAWFFNPFAWQFIFTAGVVTATCWRDGPPRRASLLLMSGLGVLACALAATDAFWLAPGLRDGLFAHLDVSKQNLGLVRLAHFAALAYLLAAAPSFTRIAESPAGQAVQTLGRHSLPVFAAGSVLAALGQAALGAAEPFASVELEQFAALGYTLVSVACLFVLVRWIECRKPAVAPRAVVLSPRLAGSRGSA